MEIARHVLRLESQRRPDVLPTTVARTIGSQHTDYSVGLIVEMDGAADDVAVGTEAALPDSVAQDDNLLFARLVLVGRKRTAKRGPFLKNVEVVRRHARAAELYRHAHAGGSGGAACIGGPGRGKGRLPL